MIPMSAFKQLLWPFVQQHRRGIATIVLLGFANSCCTLLVPLSIGKYMDILFNVQTSKGKALSLVGIHLPNSMVLFFIFFGLLLVGKLLTAWGGEYLGNCYADRYVDSLRQRLYHYHLTVKTGGGLIEATSLTAYSNEMKTQQQWLLKGITGLAKDILFLLLSLYVLFALQPLLSGIALLFLPIFYWLHRLMSQRMQPEYKARRKSQASLFGFITEQLLGSVPTNNTADFHKKSGQWLQKGTHYHRKAALLRAMAPLLLYAMLGTLLLAMAFAPGEPLMNSSDTITYVLLLMMLFPTLRNTLRIEKTWMQAKVSARKFLKSV
jgi:ATP-binding cassette, subfamily B, multidrug efflux pump